MLFTKVGITLYVELHRHWCGNTMDIFALMDYSGSRVVRNILFDECQSMALTSKGGRKTHGKLNFGVNESLLLILLCCVIRETC